MSENEKKRSRKVIPGLGKISEKGTERMQEPEDGKPCKEKMSLGH